MSSAATLPSPVAQELDEWRAWLLALCPRQVAGPGISAQELDEWARIWQKPFEDTPSSRQEFLAELRTFLFGSPAFVWEQQASSSPDRAFRMGHARKWAGPLLVAHLDEIADFDPDDGQVVVDQPPADTLSCLRQLSTRFGFASISLGPRIPSASWVLALARGLGEMADALGMEEKAIGNGHLSLALGVRVQDTATGSYDPLSHTVHIDADEDARGAFAHEWFHAIDWVAGSALSGTNGPGSIPATRQVSPPPAFRLPVGDGSCPLPACSHDYYQELLEGVEQGFLRLAEDAPSAVWKERLVRRASAWRQWRRMVTEADLDPERLDALWQRWQTGNRLLWIGLEASPEWMARLKRWQQLGEKLLQGPPQAPQAWLAFAQAKDEGASQPYWSAPEEVFARAMHAVLIARTSSWNLACAARLDADQCPVAASLARWEQWWADNSKEWLATWRQRPPLPSWPSRDQALSQRKSLHE